MPRGFTLIEIMISVAIVLMLMLGINFIFSTSARTVSTGMALSNVGRDLRNARRVLEADFKNAVPAIEMPALIIHNEAVFAWRDRQDKLTDDDNNPATYDVDGDPGDEIVMTAPPYDNLVNFRRHRQDRISFFVNKLDGDYVRQTGDANTYVGADKSSQAWISYGLLRQPGRNTAPALDGVTYWKPGARGPANQDEGFNQNNFFASQWILGRNVVLLKDAGSISTGTVAYRAAPAFITFGATAATGTGPFNRETPPYPTPATAWAIQESRIDLAATTIENLRTYLAGVVPTWWADVDATADAIAYSAAPAILSLNYLFWAKPFIDKSDFSDTNFAQAIAHQTREAALMTPIFLRGCSQFMVEFAGDFYDQSTGGDEPLGTIDYDTIGTGPNAPTQIRWYGMDRDMTDAGNTIVPGSGDITGVSAYMTETGNVPRFIVPPPPAPQRAPFERVVGRIWAWGPTTGSPQGVGAPGDASHVRPSLIRITIELIDANGRLPDGQRMEFIYKLTN